jgi:hypothetical protein
LSRTSADWNPYAANATSIPQGLTFRQRAAGLAVGLLVAVASAASMLALAFGILMAVAGRELPPPMRFSEVLNTRAGQAFAAGSLGIIPASLFLGVRACRRVFRYHRNIQEAMSRRDELRQQLQQLKDARGMKAGGSTDPLQQRTIYGEQTGSA